MLFEKSLEALARRGTSSGLYLDARELPVEFTPPPQFLQRL